MPVWRSEPQTQMYLQQRIVIHSPSFMLTFQASYEKATLNEHQHLLDILS